jgi:esterase/lipase
MTKNNAIRLACAMGLLLSLSLSGGFGCAAVRQGSAPLGQTSFEEYRLQTRRWIADRRDFQTDDRALELDWNGPREWRPETDTGKGILLVHGLGDSPWSFWDIGAVLARNGYLVRTVLLPGCGTRPEDMLDVEVGEWRRVVAEQASIMAAEVNELYLGGFSTGANLVIEEAALNPEVRGLVLFSPALWTDQPLDFLSPLAALFVDWILEPRPDRPRQSAVRYNIVPTNAFAQFYRTCVSARAALRAHPFDKPALVVLSEHDSVLDVRRILGTFDRLFPHPGSRLIWYGNETAAQGVSDRVLVRPDSLPELRIHSFSHMGALFSPDNPLYGMNGSLRICNGQGKEGSERCRAGEDVWYSAWGNVRPGANMARLTFNPYFDWQAGRMLEVLAAARP